MGLKETANKAKAAAADELTNNLRRIDKTIIGHIQTLESILEDFCSNEKKTSLLDEVYSDDLDLELLESKRQNITAKFDELFTELKNVSRDNRSKF